MSFTKYVCKECLISSGVSCITPCCVTMDDRLCGPTHCLIDADERPEWVPYERGC